jgi:pimeloyl-ACP methyl ester carboxylesterase
MIVGAAFSFDWGLVQPEVAKFTRVCTFDPSGTAWSDSVEASIGASGSKAHNSGAGSPSPGCEDRVDEIHRLIQKAPIAGPYLLVGFSVGALWERLYAARYPANIVGMVIVDHAFIGDPKAGISTQAKRPARGNIAPVLTSQAPIALGFEDNSNFTKLTERDQKLHMWALAQHPVSPGYEMTLDCSARIESATRQRARPLGDVPLTVISTTNAARGYPELQTKLLQLSDHSGQVFAWNSSHMVLIDEPEVVVKAIHDLVEIAR